nr:MAG TPA: HrcA protein C terminal domain [Caudoviricetes sp.]
MPSLKGHVCAVLFTKRGVLGVFGPVRICYILEW